MAVPNLNDLVLVTTPDSALSTELSIGTILGLPVTAWQPLGPNQGRVAPSGVYGHSMKLDSTGAPVVAWYTGGDTNAGHVGFVVRFA